VTLGLLHPEAANGGGVKEVLTGRVEGGDGRATRRGVAKVREQSESVVASVLHRSNLIM
jgi:hypothetical protein